MYEEARQRRDATIALLERESIPYLPSLPLIEAEADITPKAPHEILKKFLTTLFTIQLAFDVQAGGDTDKPMALYANTLQAYGIEVADLSADEITIWNKTCTEQDITNMVWRYEAIWLLFWAMGFIDTLPYPSDICDVHAMLNIVSPVNDSLDVLLSKVYMRTKKELLDMSDYIYCLRWASVDAHINDRPQPAGLNASVLVERHRAINWLTLADEDDFDNVSLDT